jgi:hypothetical protein
MLLGKAEVVEESARCEGRWSQEKEEEAALRGVVSDS